jgi:hypothetical protein
MIAQVSSVPVRRSSIRITSSSANAASIAAPRRSSSRTMLTPMLLPCAFGLTTQGKPSA